MFNKLQFLIVSLIFISSSILAQSGSLEGKITDKNTGETVPFANVVAERNGNQVAGVTTDFDGNYTIKPLDPGTYDLLYPLLVMVRLLSKVLLFLQIKLHLEMFNYLRELISKR